jgi:hypothetical protein
MASHENAVIFLLVSGTISHTHELTQMRGGREMNDDRRTDFNLQNTARLDASGEMYRHLKSEVASRAEIIPC